ncbi:hypothetical protein ACFQS2_00365 [Brachybacterium sp. GCM10030267]|uniref:DUF7701 domain-containing protein n=1 Tax=unclassified Brachybacterium TaxID=2623841 RepID=UPI003623FBE6
MDLNYLDNIALQIRARVPASNLPDDDVRGLFRIYAVLLLAKGVAVAPEDVHNAWAAWMIEKDSTHEAIVPFSALPRDVALEDTLYAEAIRIAAEMMS